MEPVEQCLSTTRSNPSKGDYLPNLSCIAACHIYFLLQILYESTYKVGGTQIRYRPVAIWVAYNGFVQHISVMSVYMNAYPEKILDLQKVTHDLKGLCHHKLTNCLNQVFMLNIFLGMFEVFLIFHVTICLTKIQKSCSFYSGH